MKFTFIGFCACVNHVITRLDTETTRGLVGWAEADIGVYSCP